MNYKYVLWVNNKYRIIHQQLSAHRLPCSRVFSSKCRVASITLCVIGAASSLLVYFGVSRSEALLMVSSTGYLDAHRVMLICSCFNHALLVTHERLAIIVSDPGCDGCILLYSY
jgi:hypothetical protein